MSMPQIRGQPGHGAPDLLRATGTLLQSPDGERMAEIVNARSWTPWTAAQADGPHQVQEHGVDSRIGQAGPPQRDEEGAARAAHLPTADQVALESLLGCRVQRYQPTFTELRLCDDQPRRCELIELERQGFRDA